MTQFPVCSHVKGQFYSPIFFSVLASLLFSVRESNKILQTIVSTYELLVYKDLYHVLPILMSEYKYFVKYKGGVAIDAHVN